MGFVNKTFRRDNIGAFALGVLAFEGFGIRLLDDVLPSPIIWWTIVLVLLNYKYLLKVGSWFWVKVFCLIFFYFIFNYIKGIDAPVFIAAAWMSSAIVLSRYLDKKNSFIADMRKLARFCLWYHLLHIPLMPFASSFPHVFFGMDYSTLYFFWFMGDGDDIEKIHRICGFAWEPSCWNVLINLNLVFCLFYNESKNVLILSLIALVSTFSTTALVTMVVILCVYYFFQVGERGFLRKIVLGGIILVAVIPITYNNFTNKMETGSGQARGGDIIVAQAVLKQNPLLGEDISNISKLSYAMKARDDYWTAGTNGNREMVAGMTNGLAGLFVEWGLIVSSIIILLSFLTPLFVEQKLKYLYLVAVFSVLMGTPISQTGFFYVYPFSYIFLKKKTNK